MFVIGMVLFDTGILGHRDERQEGVNSQQADFTPPALSAIPKGPQGDAVRRGMQIFLNPGTNARQFVGNSLACANCHLDAGRKADSAPMWAAWVAYPKYRSKNKQINTMEDRVKGCFTYSMNAQDGPTGKPPPPGSEIYKDLETYFHWLHDYRDGVEDILQSAPATRLLTSGRRYRRQARAFGRFCRHAPGACPPSFVRPLENSHETAARHQDAGYVSARDRWSNDVAAAPLLSAVRTARLQPVGKPVVARPNPDADSRSSCAFLGKGSNPYKS